MTKALVAAALLASIAFAIYGVATAHSVTGGPKWPTSFSTASGL